MPYTLFCLGLPLFPPLKNALREVTDVQFVVHPSPGKAVCTVGCVVFNVETTQTSLADAS